MTRTLLPLVGGVYLLLLVIVIVFQGRMIFLPPMPVSSAKPSMAFDDLHIPVTANTHIHAWWIPAREKTSTVILYFHGNAQLLEDEADNEVPLFIQTGANLLLVEYRGYGGSSPLQTSGATATEDARAAMGYLSAKGFAPSRIIVAGWSIGSAVAVNLAVETPGLKGLVLFSPITSVTDVAKEMEVFRYLLRPALWFLGSNRLDSEAKISSVPAPLLMFSGSVDTLAVPAMARRLLAQANEPKRLVTIQGAGHEDVMLHRDGTVERELGAFVGVAGSDD
jgi:pimeloyl-ACP methyl ester carboxylesterase